MPPAQYPPCPVATNFAAQRNDAMWVNVTYSIDSRQRLLTFGTIWQAEGRVSLSQLLGLVTYRSWGPR